jgi:hypothetical protein
MPRTISIGVRHAVVPEGLDYGPQLGKGVHAWNVGMVRVAKPLGVPQAVDDDKHDMLGLISRCARGRNDQGCEEKHKRSRLRCGVKIPMPCYRVRIHCSSNIIDDGRLRTSFRQGPYLTRTIRAIRVPLSAASRQK